jgi:AcrR family transcriptional regulator
MTKTSRAFSKALARPPRDTRSVSANKASKKPSRAVKSLREAQKDLTRGLLMKCALKLFDERGYANTTVDDIAASAGTTRTTFYQHFKSKAELTKALILEVNEILTSSDDPPLATVIESGNREAIRDWITRKVNQWEQIRQYVMAAHQAAALEDEIQAATQRWFESAIGAIDAGLTLANRFEPASRHIRGVLAFGQLEFFSRRWMHFGWDLDRDETIRLLTDAWCFLLTK